MATVGMIADQSTAGGTCSTPNEGTLFTVGGTANSRTAETTDKRSRLGIVLAGGRCQRHRSTHGNDGCD